MSQSHFFEGPEKKLELVFKTGEGNLLSFSRNYWEELVSLAQAKILSSIETSSCKAFLLSESSLFVWSDRLILLTCGTTTLIKSAEFLLDTFENKISQIFFERKNEYFPVFQKTTAIDDMKILNERLDGEVLRFGREDDHNLYLFNKNLKGTAKKSKTFELLMYGLKGEFKDSFQEDECKKKSVIKKISEIFKGYKLDPFFFNPEGFSLNALKGDMYATIHVTPQGDENYFSFEMDCENFTDGEAIARQLVELCKPISYDVILFSTDVEVLKNNFKFLNYETKQRSTSYIESGYQVMYEHFYDKNSVLIEAKRGI